MADIIAQYIPNKNIVDLITWVNPKLSAGVFGAVTMAYYLLERSGYTVLSLISIILMLGIIVSVLWTRIATVLGIAPPPIPKLELVDADVRITVDSIVAALNKTFAILHDVVGGSNTVLSLKYIGGLFFAGKIGGLFHFLTLVYLLVFVGFVFPKVYIHKQKEVDTVMSTGLEYLKTGYDALKRAIEGALHSKRTTTGSPDGPGGKAKDN